MKRPPAPPPPNARPAPRRSRRWAFRVIALLSTLLLLAALEVGLRVADYGYPTSFFVPQRVDGQEVLTDNWQFGWRFFPIAIARTPYKASDTVRLFVFDELAAMDDPLPAFGLPRINYGVLRAMLGRVKEAEREFAETVKREPNHTQAKEFLQRA